MGIGYNGGMIVGNYAEDLKLDNSHNIWEYAEDKGMEVMSLYYDALDENCAIGYEIENIDTEDMDIAWLKKVKELGIKFKKITGLDPILMGIQDIT
jgi:hypothetical protein